MTRRVRRESRDRAGVLAAVVILAVMMAGGCGYFRPAKPEAPSQPSIIPNYRLPESTLETLARGIADKGLTNGQAAYTGGFAEGFRATFDPQTLSRMRQQNVIIPDEWDLNHEVAFYSKFVTLSLVPANSTYLFVWSVDNTQGEDVTDSDPNILHKEYTVEAILPSGDRQTIARGFATLYLSKVSAGKWAIVRWEDREASDARIDLGEVCFGQRRLEP